MSRRAQFIGAAILGGLGLVILLSIAFGGSGSVREYIDDTYTKSTSTDPALKGARVYTASGSSTEVADAIAKKWKPAERLVDPAGHFLRYRSDMVVVSPAGDAAGKSRIVVDHEERGYARWYPFIGGYWGTYSSPGGDVRGGGPGAGK